MKVVKNVPLLFFILKAYIFAQTSEIEIYLLMQAFCFFPHLSPTLQSF